MQIILLERVPNLGQMGDVVKVKDGYARNYLLPQGKALRANEANLARFETQKADLEARNLERKNEAESIHGKLDDTIYVVIRSAGETGQLYGSVSPRDIGSALEEEGFKVARSQIALKAPIKVIGLHEVEVVLHPEVTSNITINVARSTDEAERQAAGEDLTKRTDDFEIETGGGEQDDDEADLSEIFENEEDAAAAQEESEAAAEQEALEEAAEEASTQTNEEGADADEASDDSAIPFVDNIVLIDGIGDKTAEALIAEGVSTLTAVAEMSDEDLAALSEKVGAGQQWETKQWKIQAQEMIDGKPPRSKVDQALAKKLAKQAG